MFLPRGFGFWFLISAPWLQNRRPVVAQPQTVLHLAAFAVHCPVAFAVRGGLESGSGLHETLAFAVASGAAFVVKGHLKVAQLGRLRHPLVLLGVALPG